MAVSLKAFTVGLCGILLLSCSNQSRYSQQHDSAPTRLPTPAELENATPVQEPHSPQGNQNYQVRGQRYSVLSTAEGYSAQGIASWYGNKFHGHLTSNGEYYDMYSMSAAHKRLPLPSYVRVTNLANDKSVIVRVNDRGPFHDNRLIDLSFAAAYKLDMLDQGTAEVMVEAIDFRAPLQQTEYFVQLVASSDAAKVAKLRQRLPKKWQTIATTQVIKGLHKLMLGPLPQAEANKKLDAVRQQGFPRAFRVKTSQINSPSTDAQLDK